VARLLVRLTAFGLVNLLAGRTVVPELLQRQASPQRMAEELERLLSDPAARREQLQGLSEVRRSLGEPGAPRRVAEEIARMAGT
jgi:lipid-A-disaccharide synthase